MEVVGADFTEPQGPPPTQGQWAVHKQQIASVWKAALAPWRWWRSTERGELPVDVESPGFTTAGRARTRPRSCSGGSHRCLLLVTRVALVLVLSACVLGTALCVLRLYAAAVYGEAESLGLNLQNRRVLIVQTQMAAWVNCMIMGADALTSNLHRQGLVPTLFKDPSDAKSRRLMWESFKSLSLCEHVFYATERGLTAYMRGEDGTTPLLIQANPVDPGAPLGNWSGSVVPVDPLLGEPVAGAEAAVLRPLLTLPAQPLYLAALTTLPGAVSWRLAPALVTSSGGADVVMHYSATGMLGLAGSSSPGIDGSGSEPNITAGSGSEPTRGSELNMTVRSAALRAVGIAGVGHNILDVRRQVGTLGFSGGRVFFSRVSDGQMVFSNKGSLFLSLDGRAALSAITAEESDDPVIAAAARHLRATFPSAYPASPPGPGPSSSAQRGSGQASTRMQHDTGGHGSEDDMPSAAAQSGLCWDRYFKRIMIDGRSWYLHCEGKLYGSGEATLALVGVFLVPTNSIMGEIEKERKRSVVTVVGVAFLFAATGMLCVFVTTVYVDQMATRKKALEGRVEKQEGEMRVMAQELDLVRALLPGGSAHALDMRTPMQALHDMLGELTEQNVLPGPIEFLRIQALLRMPEPHMPILLQQSLGTRDSTQGAPAPQLPSDPRLESGQALDAEMRAWLRSTVLQMPPRSTPVGARDARQSFEESSNSSASHVSRLVHSFSLDSIGEVLGHVMQVEDIGEGKSGAEYVESHDVAAVAVRALPGRDRGKGKADAVSATGSSAAVNLPRLRGIRSTLEMVGAWNFDTWALATASGARPILWMGLELYRRAGLLRAFDLPLDKLGRFLAKLDEGMPANNYHNSTHIADVAASLYHLLKYSGLSAYLTRLDVLAAVTAALVHDFRHPGLNNDFVVKSSDTLALRYNDRTVLENYHVAEAFHLMTDDGLNFLGVLSVEDYKYVRNVIIELVLGSDLKRHFELVESFKARAKDKESPLTKSNEGDRLLLMQIALKVADIGHSAKTLAIHRRWTDAITEEFYLQGDKERAAGFKVSPFMDRDNNNLARSQLGFFSFIAFPLFEAWVATFPDSQPIMEEMTANIKYWEGRRDGVVG